MGASNVGAGTLALTSGGTLSETGPLIQAPSAGAITLTLTTPSSDILFASQPNDLNGAVYFAGDLSNIRDLERRNVNANPAGIGTNLALLTNLRNVTIILDNASLTGGAVTLHNGGSLYVDTSGSLSGGTGGSINQLGAITVPGTVTLIAGAHAITATQSNSVAGDVYLTNSGNSNVAFTTSGLFHLGTSSVGSGTLTLTGLGITQDGAITQAAGAGAATINAGAAAIDLSNASNVFTGPVSLNNSGNNAVSLTNNAALTLGTSNIGSGTLTLTMGGNLSETGAITQGADAGTFSIISTVPSTDIDLSTAANNISGSMTFGGTLSNLQDINLRNAHSNAALPTNLASLSNLRNLTLQFDLVGISFPALTLHNGGNLSVITGDDINQAGALVVPGTSSFSVGANPITLNQNNVFGGAVSFANSGANDIAVTNNGALILGTSNVGTGIFTANSVGVSQTGALTQASGAGAATFNAGAGAIALTQNNLFTGSVALSNTGANNVALTNSAALSLGALNIGSGTLDVISGGTISQINPITQEANAGITTYSFTAPSSDLLLTQANNTNGYINIGGTLSNLRDVSLRNIGTANQTVVNLQSLTSLRNLTVILDNVGLSLPALTLHSGGNLVIDTSGSLSGGIGGAISQTGVLTVPGTSSFSAGAHAITMTQNNAFTGGVTLTNSGANDVVLTNSVALNLSASNIGSGMLTLTGAGVTQTGAITQEAHAGATTINAGANAINLSSSNNNLTGAVSFNNSGANNVTLQNAGGLTLGTSSLGTGTLSLTAGGNINETGAITQAANAGAITLTTTGDSSSMLFDQANNLNGALSFGGNLGFIDTLSLRNTNAGATLPTNLTSLTNLINLTLVFNNAGISFPALSLHSGGNLNVSTGGSITQTGILTVPGTSSFNAGANPITLTQNNALAGAVSLTNSGVNDVNLTTSGALQLAASTIGGNLTSVAGGGITLSDVITAGNSIVLSGTSFTNNAGASALSPGTGNFLVWSANPVNDARGGLVYNFKQYNATYGVTPVAGTGSGFLYTIAPTITPSLTGTVSKSYTGTTTATLAPSNYTFSGNIDGDTVTLNNPSSGTYASVNVGTNINISVSGITIVSATDGSATVYGYQITPTANANIGTITQADLTIRANDASKSYGQTTTFTGSEFTPTGLQNGETVGSVSLASSGAINTANVAGSPYAITASAATGGTFNPANYSISYTDGALTVNPASLSVTANNASKTYGETVAFSGDEFTHSALQNGETMGSVTLTSSGAVSTANVIGSPYNIVPSNATGGTFNPANYSIAYTNGALTVNPATLTVAADNVSKTYGQTNVFTGSEFTSAGLQNSETIGSVTLTSSGTSGTASVAGGPYTITASAATGGTFNPANYSISYTDGALTVNPATLIVAANNTNKTYGQTVTFTGNEFTPTGLQNGETIGSVLLVSSGAINTADVSNSPYVIGISAATGGTFNPANYNLSYTDGALTVNPATLTYIANSASRAYGVENPAFSGTVTGFVLGQTQQTATTGTLAFTSTASSTTSAGNYPIVGSGLDANKGNYTFVQAPGNQTALTINPVAAPINKQQIVSVIMSATQNNNYTAVSSPISIEIIPSDEDTVASGIRGVIIETTPVGHKVGPVITSTLESTQEIPPVEEAAASVNGVYQDLLAIKPMLHYAFLPKVYSFNNIAKLEQREMIDLNNKLKQLDNYTRILIALAVITSMTFLLKTSAASVLSFKMRDSLNTIVGFAKIFASGKLGPVTPQEDEYLKEILQGTAILSAELAKVESEKKMNIDKRMAFKLRTALMNINGYSQLIRHLDGHVNKQQKECLEEINSGARKVMDLLSA